MTDDVLAQSVASRSETDPAAPFRGRLESAQQLLRTGQRSKAAPLLAKLLYEDAPDAVKREALLELAVLAQAEDDLARAQQIYAQFLNRWPNDLRVPEILLRQGRLYRQMGLNDLSLTKFYSVMTSALALKNDKLQEYQSLVLLAQTEIAESHFQAGKHKEAADFFSRLLKQNSPGLNRPLAQYRLVCSLGALGQSQEQIAQGLDFLARYPEAPEQPEVRFYVASALKRVGRNNEALEQVLALLQEQHQRTRAQPELWAHWQQRAGNEIGNQLYREGNYTSALELYTRLAQLNPQPAWQLPATYQIGLTYERLSQPEQALRTYQSILRREAELGTNASPGLKAVLEMAHWRADFVQWESRAELQSRALHRPALPDPSAAKAGKPQFSNP